jgi:hypothetical protein
MSRPAGSIGGGNTLPVGACRRRTQGPNRPRIRNCPIPVACAPRVAPPVNVDAEGVLHRYRVAQPDGTEMPWEVLAPAPALSAVGHHYGLETMRIALHWICLANISFRAAAKCFTPLAGQEQPSFWSIRLWVLRLGLYELTRPKEHGQDWVFIVDATIALGPHKALIILGVPLSQMQQAGFNLGHQDVVCLAIRITAHCTGQVVLEGLNSASGAVGVPVLIVSDGGSDVKKGVTLFQAEHPEVVWNYDLSHRLALLLEEELGSQEWWADFLTQTAGCRQECQQTAWAHLQPPALRIKARWLNVKPLVNWALRVIDYGQRQRLHTGPFARLFGWLYGYERALEQARQMLIVLEQTSTLIKAQGLSFRQVCRCEKKLRGLHFKGLVQRLVNRVLTFLWEQVANLPPGQAFLDSSDVLESLFGKFKAVVERSPLRAITEMVLLLAALTSPRTIEAIQAAMETVPAAQVRDWFAANGEPSLLAQRRQALG